MDWVRTNKFLAGYLAALIVSVAVVGYLLYASYSRYDQVSQEYTTQANELKRLENLKPYPEESNLKRFGDQKKAFAEAVTSLQDNLAKMSAISDKPVSPSEFQNRLRDVVSDVLHSATQNGVAVPDGFYLGFEQYRAKLPDAAVTILLSAELNNIEKMVRIFINGKVDKINAVKLAPLPGEGSGSSSPASNDKSKGSKGVTQELVVRRPVEIDITASANSFREALAKVVEDKSLFVIRAMQVKNQVQEGPVRGLENAVPGGAARAATPPPMPSPGTPPAGAPGADQPLPEKGPAPLRYVLGQEKVDVAMHIEIAQVTPPR